MAIDEPLDAFRTALENDKRAAPNEGGKLVVSAAAAIVKHLALGPYGGAALDAVGLLVQRRISNLEELLETVDHEFKYHRRLIDQLSAASEAHRRFRQEDLPGLILDACHKAEDTRARDRIRRIGRILVNSLTVDPPPMADDVEELMRAAMALEDRDVLLLNELCRRRAEWWDDDRGRAEPHDTEDTDAADVELAALVGSPGDLASSIAKLQSFGFIDPLLGSEVTVPGYVLLDKARRFVRFAVSAAHATLSAGT